MSSISFSKALISKVSRSYPTPFYLYDERGIRKSIRLLKKAFSWHPSFREYFAVKATPNPSILKIMKSEGLGLDCSSLPELLLAERTGFAGDMIMFSSNNTPLQEFKKAKQLKAFINFDDISHISMMQKAYGLPKKVALRYNPGATRTGTSIMGAPKDAKFGMTKKQILEGLMLLKKHGVTEFGLHTMIISNELREQYFIDTASMMFDLVIDVKKRLGIDISSVNLGGGIGIPYRPRQKPFDIAKTGKATQRLYMKALKKGAKPFALHLECGRYITGPHGYLITKVRHFKDIYKKYVGLDASMADLMRPGMYGAYHEITVLGKENKPRNHIYDVTGSLCENNDKFAIDRKLPRLDYGDVVIIHDVGAHGHAMGFNYNGRLRSAEYLVSTSGKVKMIRRAEAIGDHFATLKF
ncbi:MAG: diaminopimelate decarboxylase [Patescibacteria group bacterium]